MKSLVVDDDTVSRLVLEDVLARFGKVDIRGDGAGAVSAAALALDQGDAYDLICMDIVMPSMSGLDALHLIRDNEMRREGPRAKVIVITGDADTGPIGKAFGRLCDAYIAKPIDPEEFLNLLECLCQIDRC
jgi:two-component system, chemotaxis family, chemotaxis protein CheY